MDRATLDALLGKRNDTASGFPEDDVVVPGIGTVRVRGLSRYEALSLDGSKYGPREIEQLVLLAGMVDPALTQAQIITWQKAADSNEITPVVKKINELSKVGEDAAKTAYKSDGDGSDA